MVRRKGNSLWADDGEDGGYHQQCSTPRVCHDPSPSISTQCGMSSVGSVAANTPRFSVGSCDTFWNGSSQASSWPRGRTEQRDTSGSRAQSLGQSSVATTDYDDDELWAEDMSYPPVHDSSSMVVLPELDVPQPGTMSFFGYRIRLPGFCQASYDAPRVQEPRRAKKANAFVGGVGASRRKSALRTCTVAGEVCKEVSADICVERENAGMRTAVDSQPVLTFPNRGRVQFEERPFHARPRAEQGGLMTGQQREEVRERRRLASQPPVQSGFLQLR